MIQRIQSVYLFLVAVLSILMFCFPILSFVQNDGYTMTMNFCGMKDSTTVLVRGEFFIVLAGLMVVNVLVALGTIFLYKKRMFQIRLCIFNSILFLLDYVVMAGLYMFYMYISNAGHLALGFGSIVPAVNLILTYLAIRGIGADEALVRSMDRLR